MDTRSQRLANISLTAKITFSHRTHPLQTMLTLRMILMQPQIKGKEAGRQPRQKNNVG